MRWTKRQVKKLDALPAGRELDLFVAEMVTKPSFEGHPMFTGDWAIDRVSAHLWKDLYGRLLLPLYSTDIASAFEVVKKISDDEVRVCRNRGHTCLTLCDCGGGEQWAATFFPITSDWSVHWDDQNIVGEDYEVVAYADSAPLAICRAALKAVFL